MRRGEETDMIHTLMVPQSFLQCKPECFFSVSPSEFNLIFWFPERPLGGAVIVNKQANDSKKGQTMNVRMQGFVE